MREPARALPQPAHLIGEPVRDQLAAVQFRVIIAIGVFPGRPARRPQLTQRRVQLTEVGGGHDLVHPRGREPGRGGERANGHVLGAGRRQRPAALPFGLLQPPRGTGDPRQDSPHPSARLDPLVDRHPPIVPAAFRKPGRS